MSRLLRIAVAVLLALAWSGCSTSTTTSRTTQSPSPGASAAEPVQGAANWHACDATSNFQCADISVPLDYTNPHGEKIRLALAKLPASDPQHRIGSLLTNPGGPGESGIQFLKTASTTFFSAQLRTRFDIVTWDPRGTGSSSAVDCFNSSQLDAFFHLDPNLNTPERLAAGLQEFHTFDDACVAHSGNLLKHISTEDSARDIDQIRQALGETQISYLGFSYGTFLGAVYAHFFPTHVRIWVLDGAVDPYQTYSGVAITQTTGFQQDYTDFLAHCVSQGAGCPIYNGGNPGALIDNFLARVETNPIPLGSRSLGLSEASTGLLAAMYDPSSWNDLEDAIALANRGSAAVLMEFNDSYVERNPDGTYSNSLEANIAINCVDYAAPTTVEAYQSLAAQLTAISPHFGNISAWSPCIYWPVPPVQLPPNLTAPGAPPILIISGTHDPATPLSWGQNLHSQIAGSIFITRNGDGHISYDKSTCIRNYVDNYLISKTPPPNGASC